MLITALIAVSVLLAIAVAFGIDQTIKINQWKDRYDSLHRNINALHTDVKRWSTTADTRQEFIDELKQQQENDSKEHDEYAAQVNTVVKWLARHAGIDMSRYENVGFDGDTRINTMLLAGDILSRAEEENIENEIFERDARLGLIEVPLETDGKDESNAEA